MKPSTKLIASFLLFVGLFALMTLIIMLIWNALMPDLMNANTMSYSQALLVSTGIWAIKILLL